MLSLKEISLNLTGAFPNSTLALRFSEETLPVAAATAISAAKEAVDHKSNAAETLNNVVSRLKVFVDVIDEAAKVGLIMFKKNLP